MTLVTPTQSNPNDEIRAASINDPVNQLADVINGNIDDTNISSVSGSKIANATITNAKLSTAAGELGGEWTDWTPTITASGSMTISSVTIEEARYKTIGKTVFFSMRAFFTTGGTASATISFTVPVNIKSSIALSMGSALAVDTSVLTGTAFRGSSTTISVRRYDSGNWSLGVGRAIAVSGFYEVA